MTTQSPLHVSAAPVRVESAPRSATVQPLRAASREPIAYNAAPAPVPLWRRAFPWVIGFVVCCAWDRAVWLVATRDGVPKLAALERSIDGAAFLAAVKAAAHADKAAVGHVLEGVAYGAVYLFGRIWPWIGLAMFFIFRHWGGTDGSKVGQGLRRGVFVVLTPGLAGLLAEALKLITRRERPEDAAGMYAFLPWPKLSALSPEFWSTSHIGLASSHAAVAFGGALAAGLLLPRWRWAFLAMAVLCTVSRVAVGAHFLSDAVAGVACGFAMFALVYAWDRRNNGGVALAP